MKTRKKHKKLKVFLIFIYIIVLLIYAFFVFGKFLFASHGEDLNLFGKSIHVLENGQAVSVDYSKDSSEGDKIVCTVDDKKYVAEVLSTSKSKDLTIQVNIDGTNQYFTASKNSGVIVDYIGKLGKIYQFVHSIYGLILIVILSCVFIIVYEIIKIIFTSKNKDDDSVELDVYNPDIENSPFGNIQSNPIENELSNNPLSQNYKSPYKPQNANYNSDLSSNFLKNTTMPKDEESFKDETLDDIKYKMDFQDTRELSNKYNEFIQNGNKQSNILNKYGISTTHIDDGVEVSINPKAINSLILKLKNDGTLEIKSDNYIANIDIQF